MDIEPEEELAQDKGEHPAVPSSSVVTHHKHLDGSPKKTPVADPEAEIEKMIGGDSKKQPGEEDQEDRMEEEEGSREKEDENSGNEARET